MPTAIKKVRITVLSWRRDNWSVYHLRHSCCRVCSGNLELRSCRTRFGWKQYRNCLHQYRIWAISSRWTLWKNCPVHQRQAEGKCNKRKKDGRFEGRYNCIETESIWKSAEFLDNSLKPYYNKKEIRDTKYGYRFVSFFVLKGE